MLVTTPPFFPCPRSLLTPLCSHAALYPQLATAPNENNEPVLLADLLADRGEDGAKVDMSKLTDGATDMLGHMTKHINNVKEVSARPVSARPVGDDLLK